MISYEILIAFAALVVMGLIYFAGVQRGKQQSQKTEKEVRIKDVKNKYLENLNSGRTANFDGLMKAGVASLRDDKEIRELCRRITEHGVGHPFATCSPLLEEVDLHSFFSYALSKRINFNGINIADFVEQFKALQKEQ